MGSNSKSEGLTILSLCDLLQEILIENGMEDAPVGLVFDSEGWYPLYPYQVRIVGERGVDRTVGIVA